MILIITLVSFLINLIELIFIVYTAVQTKRHVKEHATSVVEALKIGEWYNSSQL